MSKRPKFSLLEEEEIIDFVRNHEILFNMRHKNYRDSKAKNRLWVELGKQLDNDAENVKKKWISMRDYFIRNKEKKTTGSAAAITKRDESLMFLLDQSIPKRRTLSNITSSASDSSMSSEQMMPIEEIMYSTLVNDDQAPIPDNRETTPASGHFSCAGRKPVVVETPRQLGKRTAPSDVHAELLREFLNRKQPTPMDFIPAKLSAPQDHVQMFCDSLACTMRRLPSAAIAKVKLEVWQIVGKEELAWAEKEANCVFTNEKAEVANTTP